MVAGVEVGDRLPTVDLGLEVVGRARVPGSGSGWSHRACRPGIVDADDDARDRIGVLRLAAADRILEVLDLGVRVAELGREIVGPGRVEAGRVIVRVGAARSEGVLAGHLRRVAGEQVVGADRRFLETLVRAFQTVIVGDLPVDAAEQALVLERTAGDGGPVSMP